MTTIKATCPTCGEVSLTPDDIELRVDPSGALDPFYAFICPACVTVVRKPADERIVRLLVSGGVEVLHHEDAEPVRTLAERYVGPPLTHDDLLDFHALLKHDSWFEALLNASPNKRVA